MRISTLRIGLSGVQHRTRAQPAAAVRSLALVSALAAAMSLVGCAAYGPGGLQPGASGAQVRQSMGEPTLVLAAPVGSRWVYARGPFGRHTWMLDLDAAGRLSAWQQVLGEAQFTALVPGMTEAQVLFAFGPPAQRGARGLRPGELWSWRYPTNDCLWFQVEFDQGRVVEGGSYAADPVCDTPTRD